VTTVLDMPNTNPPTSTPERLADKARRAAAQAVCDVGLFVGATNTEADAYLPVAAQACGLKIYVSDTFGSLRIDTLDLMHRLFRTWAEKAAQVGYRMMGAAHGLGPITVHAEELMLPVCLALSHLYAVPLHIAHVSRRSEIELIRGGEGARSRRHLRGHAAPPLSFDDDLPRLGNAATCARGWRRPTTWPRSGKTWKSWTSSPPTTRRTRWRKRGSA
jgi:dihydroorotase-like cyclic amidohydrolase